MIHPDFKYPLVAIERLYCSRLDQAQATFLDAVSARDRARRHLSELQTGLAQFYASWREGLASGRMLDPQCHLSACAALAGWRERIDQADKALRKAEAIAHTRRQELIQAQVRAQTMEAHKSLLGADHRLAFQRQEQVESDTNWLQRRR
jgi:hypothetical protein